MYCAGKKRLFLLGLTFFLVMTISGIYSLTNEVINGTESTLSTSYVDIKINEVNSDGTAFSYDKEYVMPGEEILLIPRINNLGAECYLRAKITYTIDGEKYNELNYIDGNFKEWASDGEYYYYERPVSKDESLDLFNKIRIPNDLAEDKADSNISVNVLVEGVQAKNFETWEGLEVLGAVERAYYVDTDGESTVIYENNSDQYIRLDDSFFDNLGSLLPGDSTIEEISIENSSKKTMKYYLSIDDSQMTQEEIELLEKLELVITNSNDDLIYEGDLHINNRVIFGTYAPGESDDIILKVQIPKELNNQFSKIVTKLVWNFSLDEAGEEVEPNPYTGDEDEPVEKPEQKPDTPATGDFKFDLSITVFLVSALGLLIVLILEKKETEKIEKN